MWAFFYWTIDRMNDSIAFFGLLSCCLGGISAARIVHQILLLRLPSLMDHLLYPKSERCNSRRCLVCLTDGIDMLCHCVWLIDFYFWGGFSWFSQWLENKTCCLFCCRFRFDFKSYYQSAWLLSRPSVRPSKKSRQELTSALMVTWSLVEGLELPSGELDVDSRYCWVRLLFYSLYLPPAPTLQCSNVEFNRAGRKRTRHASKMSLPLGRYNQRG